MLTCVDRLPTRTWLQGARNRLLSASQEGYGPIRRGSAPSIWEMSVKTRGRAGWRLLLGLFTLISSAYLGWLTTAWVIYGVRYARWYFRVGT